MTNNVYKFKPDTPAIICLKYRTGKPFTQGAYTGFSYTMGNGLITRFPPEASEAIQALHLDAGQPFQVTKRTLPNKQFAWDIERIPGGEEVSQKTDRPEHYNSTQPEPRGSTEYFDDTTPAIFHTEHGRDVLMHLIGAIEIAAAAEKYAQKQLNRPIRFSTNDIRAIAISCSIQQSHEQVEFNRLEALREPIISGVRLDSGLHAVSAGERGNR